MSPLLFVVKLVSYDNNNAYNRSGYFFPGHLRLLSNKVYSQDCLQDRGVDASTDAVGKYSTWYILNEHREQQGKER